MSFIFGGNTGLTPEQAEQMRKVASTLVAGSGRAPRNVGEGLHAIGRALAHRMMTRKADLAAERGREKFESDFGKVAPNASGLIGLANSPYAGKGHQAVIGALLKNVPQYARGTNYHPGGPAIVGELGPELVDLPEGAQVLPMNDPRRPVPSPPPPPDPDLMPGDGADPRGMFWQEDARLSTKPGASFAPEAEYRTADMSSIPPSGTGETNTLHGTARAFQGFMRSLADYEAKFNEDNDKDGKPDGSTMWPGTRRDALSIAHRDLQMQLKELYNLGVLNGPDLALMNEILINPTSVGGNVLDAVGVADMEKRIPANIQQVRKLMMNRSLPALQQLGIDPQQLMPAQETDEEFLKRMGLE